MNANPSPQTLKPLQDNVAFWRTQSEQLERDQKNLHYVLLAGPVAAIIAYFVTHDELWTLGVIALAVTIWGMGLYMCIVRRAEYRFARVEAERELNEAARKLEQSVDVPL